MAWNQSGNKPRGKSAKNPDRNPPSWGGGNGDNPPGLDEVLKKLNDWFGNEFKPKRILLMSLMALLLVYGGLGISRVEGGEKALILRAGKLYAVQEAGLHWNPPLFDTVKTVNVTKIEQANLTTNVMTSDEDIAAVTLVLHYRIADPESYLLHFSDAESALLRVAESVLHEVAATVPMTELAGEARARLVSAIYEKVMARFSPYHTGLLLSSVSLSAVLPPAEVKTAYDEVQRAREEAGQKKAEAEKEAAKSLQSARAESAKLLAEADAYSTAVLAQAEKDKARFTQDLADYRQAPEATRQRLYDAAMTEVLAKTRTVIVEGKGLERIGIASEKLQHPTVMPPLPDSEVKSREKRQ